jgi:antitoxin (DNA-binding transcriptional repressor) of toxin-antitoxin stability system
MWSEDQGIMTRRVKIVEAKTHLSALLADVEAGEDLIICRDPVPIARVTRTHPEAEGRDLRTERSKQRSVTTSEILAWRHEGHIR